MPRFRIIESDEKRETSFWGAVCGARTVSKTVASEANGSGSTPDSPTKLNRTDWL